MSFLRFEKVLPIVAQYGIHFVETTNIQVYGAVDRKSHTIRAHYHLENFIFILLKIIFRRRVFPPGVA